MATKRLAFFEFLTIMAEALWSMMGAADDLGLMNAWCMLGVLLKDSSSLLSVLAPSCIEDLFLKALVESSNSFLNFFSLVSSSELDSG